MNWLFVCGAWSSRMFFVCLTEDDLSDLGGGSRAWRGLWETIGREKNETENSFPPQFFMWILSPFLHSLWFFLYSNKQVE